MSLRDVIERLRPMLDDLDPSGDRAEAMRILARDALYDPNATDEDRVTAETVLAEIGEERISPDDTDDPGVWLISKWEYEENGRYRLNDLPEFDVDLQEERPLVFTSRTRAEAYCEAAGMWDEARSEREFNKKAEREYATAFRMYELEVKKFERLGAEYDKAVEAGVPESLLTRPVEPRPPGKRRFHLADHGPFYKPVPGVVDPD